MPGKSINANSLAAEQRRKYDAMVYLVLFAGVLALTILYSL